MVLWDEVLADLLHDRPQILDHLHRLGMLRRLSLDVVVLVSQNQQPVILELLQRRTHILVGLFLGGCLGQGLAPTLLQRRACLVQRILGRDFRLLQLCDLLLKLRFGVGQLLGPFLLPFKVNMQLLQGHTLLSDQLVFMLGLLDNTLQSVQELVHGVRQMLRVAAIQLLEQHPIQRLQGRILDFGRVVRVRGIGAMKPHRRDSS
mmetsp:Transcript_53824/g.95954  ORF Transcript_53824/g.95954 Transcript_53824/m.95954 type:complete len:204 (-) Transcript_53824:58-669(-)